MSILSEAVTPTRERQKSGPVLYDERRPVVTDDAGTRYQLAARASDDERFVLVTRDDDVSGSLVDALNRRNVERHALDGRADHVTAALDALAGDESERDHDALVAALDALAEPLTRPDADADADAILAPVVLDATADAETLAAALAAERERVGKARKSLPRVDADRAGRVATALMLYDATE